jgi:hypothetical protein
MRTGRARHRADDGLLWFLARLLWYLALVAVVFTIATGWNALVDPVEPAPTRAAVVNVPAPTLTPPVTPQPKPSASAKPSPEPFEYATCEDASKAKALPLRKGDAGYSRSLDTDRDGRACENYDG